MTLNDPSERKPSPEETKLVLTLIETAFRVALVWWVAQALIVFGLALLLRHFDGCATVVAPAASLP